MNKLCRYIACALLAVSLSACGWGTPVSDTNNKCVPPTYPQFLVTPMRAGERSLITTTVPITDVNRAYMDELKAVELDPNAPPNPVSKALWEMVKFSGGYVYGCSEGVSDYALEGGCIYLQPSEIGTSIHLLWEYSEGLSGCGSALRISNVSEK